ncbi:MAG: response regulator [Leptolyngbya sp. SIO3F4]|nr:response regulator [Leptolyngbya sp. SIO3F4]
MLQFKAEQLGHAILDLQHSNFCGVAYVEPLSNALELQRPRALLFLNGELIYGGLYLPDPHELSKRLGQHFKLQIMDAALQLASKKIKDQSSIRQYLELYIRLDLFSWQDIETFIRNQIVLTLEQILPYAGTIKLNSAVAVDLSYGEDGHGFTWHQLEHEIAQRQRVWVSLSPAIASVNVVPHRVEATQHTVTDPWIQQHMQQWVDGQRTLGEIAALMSRDPLELAHNYLHFVQMGWLTFEHNQTKYGPVNQTTPVTIQGSIELPTILSVDDSPVVQTMLKRAIGDQYNLLLANNAMDALNLLNREKIELLLLDVTMPDIDGLELCRTIRNIHKFRDLPVVMLTAKDGMFNKIKGQMAGSTHYLTKPIDRNKLMEVLNKYVPATITS